MKSFFKNKSSWLLWSLWGVLTLLLCGYFLRVATVQQAGDIAEYYGITQTVIAEQTLSLSSEQQAALSQVLHPAYFDNPHVYLESPKGGRFPIHFVFYSLLAVPVRVVIEAFNVDPRRSLWIVNILSLLLAVAFIWKRYVKEAWPRFVLLALTLISPLMSFLIWPGPDLWYLSLVLIGLFAFVRKEVLLAVVATSVASWHSQPLIILAMLMAGYDILTHTKVRNQQVTFDLARIFKYALVGTIGLIPYGYNFSVYGQLTPWTLLADGWTKLRGFGLHNVSWWKSYEQLFDLNVGQFWYAPLLFILGGITFLSAVIKKQWQWVVLPALFLLTAIFYQTNPGWHYGTSGYGPGRHGLLFLPLAILFSFQLLKRRTILTVLMLAITIAAHGWLLSFNNYLEPDLTKTLHHSVFATYALDKYPQYYNPTPEIFVDRTNHDDQTLPTTAIYRNDDGSCVKAWVLETEVEQVIAECGELPAAYQGYTNRFAKMSNVPRQVITTEATFWPNPDACAEWYEKTPDTPFACARTKDQLLRLASIDDETRVTTVPDFPYPGIWKLTTGEPILITVPAGYIIHYRSLDGFYINFTSTQ